MSYRVGVSGLGERAEPALICDVCGDARGVCNVHGLPFPWFLDRKRAPGWTADLAHEHRLDWCQACTERRKSK